MSATGQMPPSPEGSPMRTVGDLLRQLENVHTEKQLIFHFQGRGFECSSIVDNGDVELSFAEKEWTQPDYTRFRCNYGPDCPHCKGQGYTIGPEARREWALLTGDIDRQVALYRQRLTRALTKSFDEKHQPETPQCKMHPNVHAYIAERQAASTATIGSTKGTRPAGLLRRTTNTIVWGLKGLVSKVMAGKSSRSRT